MPVDVNEQDIPETATHADVIRAINADRQRQRSAPEKTVKLIHKYMRAAAPQMIAGALKASREMNERPLRKFKK
jgi:hypothetical protein